MLADAVGGPPAPWETRMKIAVSGKGGVGKTSLSAMLATALSLQGTRVIAIDADPDANLAAALGVPSDDQPAPLGEMKELIAERTGSAEGYGGYFKLNPKVDDIPDEFAARLGNVRLLVLGGVEKGGGGCICPATVLIKALLSHLLLHRDDTLIMDMEAGIEHLGRATAESMDALVIVVDDGPWSLQTALRTRALAADLGLTKLFVVANRIADPADVERISRQLDGLPLIGRIPLDSSIRNGAATLTADGQLRPAGWLADNLQVVDAILTRLREST